MKAKYKVGDTVKIISANKIKPNYPLLFAPTMKMYCEKYGKILDVRYYNSRHIYTLDLNQIYIWTEDMFDNERKDKLKHIEKKINESKI